MLWVKSGGEGVEEKWSVAAGVEISERSVSIDLWSFREVKSAVGGVGVLGSG